MSQATTPTPSSGTRSWAAWARRIGIGSIGVVALATAGARGVGFLRWLAQGAFVGSGAEAGAYASANQIPNIVFEIVVGGALAGITVPLLSAAIVHRTRRDVEHLASALLTWVVGILSIVAIVVFLNVDTIADLIPVPQAADDASQHLLITTFLSVFAWQIPLYGVTLVLTGILQSHGKFLASALAPLWSSLIAIATYALYGAVNSGTLDTQQAVLILAWGTTAAVAVMALSLVVPVWRLGIRLRPAWWMSGEDVRRAAALGAAGVIGLIAQQLAVIVNLYLMRSWGAEGTVAIFQYVQAVYWLPYGILAFPVATVAFPRLSACAHANSLDAFRDTAARAAAALITVSIIGVGLLIAMAPVAEAFFSLLTPVGNMAIALLCIAPALVGYGLLFFGQRVLYAINAARSAWRGAALAWCTVAGCAWTIMTVCAVRGDGDRTLAMIATSHSVGMSVGGIAMLIAIRRHAGNAALAGVGRAALSTLAVIAVPTGLAWLVTSTICRWGNEVMHPLVATIVAAIIGLAILAIALIGAYRYTPWGAILRSQRKFGSSPREEEAANATERKAQS